MVRFSVVKAIFDIAKNIAIDAPSNAYIRQVMCPDEHLWTSTEHSDRTASKPHNRTIISTITQQMTPRATKCPETMYTITGRLTTHDHLPQQCFSLYT